MVLLAIATVHVWQEQTATASSAEKAKWWLMISVNKCIKTFPSLPFCLLSFHAGTCWVAEWKHFASKILDRIAYIDRHIWCLMPIYVFSVHSVHCFHEFFYNKWNDIQNKSSMEYETLHQWRANSNICYNSLRSIER